VCRLAASGLLLKQIAATLGTSQSATQMHRVRAWTKLGVSCHPELVHLMTQLEPCAKS
jgi:DNA-binding NarL/FixJ family response regulator